LTMLPSRKSGIGFDITSCICTIIKKASLGHAIPPWWDRSFPCG
jgi:hypothetical protein